MAFTTYNTFDTHTSISVKHAHCEHPHCWLAALCSQFIFVYCWFNAKLLYFNELGCSWKLLESYSDSPAFYVKFNKCFDTNLQEIVKNQHLTNNCTNSNEIKKMIDIRKYSSQIIRCTLNLSQWNSLLPPFY